MKRRVFLGTVGSVASVGTLAYTTRDPVDTLAVRFWLSERAGEYDGVADRILEYLDRILDLEFWSLELTFGGTVSVSTEDGARVTRYGEWPLTIASGAVGRREITPVADVNLLVTDGQMEEAPTGYGVSHIASVGGAGNIASLEPFDDLLSKPESDSDRWLVPNTAPTRTMQILVHELGHALGLSHEHGVSFRYGDAIVATPMLSSYAWSGTYEGGQSHCGTSYPEPGDHERKLGLAFSSCARRELAEYSGGLTL